MSRVACITTALSAAILGGCVMDDFGELGRTFNAPTPAQAARDALDPHNADKRREGVVLLSTSTFGGAAPYLKMYRDYVEHDTDPLVKSAAITALGRHGTPEDAVLIAPWLEFTPASHKHVRWTAALALQRLHNAAVVPDLIRTALHRSEVGEVREAACTALAQYPEDRVVQALIAALDARELAVNTAATESLYTLTGQDLGMNRTAWRTWYDRALPAGEAFAGQRVYLYPTYSRGKLWWERAAFWIDHQWEVPQTPAGLDPADRRSTYEDDAAG